MADVATTTTSAPVTACSAEEAAFTPCVLCKSCRIMRAPYTDLTKLPNESQRFQVTTRLHACSKDRKNVHLLPGKQIGCDRRDRRRAHFGDEAPVHRHQRLARFGAKKQNHGVVGWDSFIVRKKSHQFRSKRAAVGGHDTEKSVVLRHWQDLSKRLYNITGR